MKNTILEIRQLFEIQGDSEYYGENVSQYEHAAQAAILAKRQGYDEEVQIAAFLHDIGHLFPALTEEELMEGYGRKDHESVAADWLRERGFSEKTAILVENHVNAKRYLTFIDEDYFEALSEASKQTLIFQGGRMTEIEAKEFEQNPYFELIIKMRRWDEAAKVEAMKLPTLDHFMDIIDIHLSKK